MDKKKCHMFTNYISNQWQPFKLTRKNIVFRGLKKMHL